MRLSHPRMLSQDQVLQNSPILGRSKPLAPTDTRETGHPLLRDLVITSLFSTRDLSSVSPANAQISLGDFLLGPRAFVTYKCLLSRYFAGRPGLEAEKRTDRHSIQRIPE